MESFVSKCIDDIDEHQDEITQLAVDMQNGLYKIVDLIEKLGLHFTSTEVTARVQACTLVSSVLSKLSDCYLFVKELSIISEFFCSKLQDYYTVQPPALTGLVKVSCCSNLDEKDAVYIIETIFKEVHVRSCLQNDRYKVYQILSNLFDNHRDSVLALGTSFVYKYIQAIDGEQDPRNLLIIFQLSTDLVKFNVDLTNLEEEFFDVAACYFPIDFNPAAVGKKTTITTQDLVLGLRSVMSSSSKFSKFCIPLCLEKLESNVENAKVDAILTLTACLSNYNKRHLQPHLSLIWIRLRQEITHVVSQDVEKSALNLLTELVKNLSQWPVEVESDQISDLNSFLTEVLSDCLPRLEEPVQDKLTWMTGLIVLACAKGSKAAYSKVITSVVPLLLSKADQYQEETPSMTKTIASLQSSVSTTIDYLVNLITISSSFSFHENQHPLSHKCKTVLGLFLKLLLQDYGTQTKCTAVVGIVSLLKIKLLSKEDLYEIIDCFVTLTCCNIDKKLLSEIMSASGYLASRHPLVVKSNMLQKIFKIVPDKSFTSIPISKVKKTFNFLSALSTHFDILKDVVLYIINFVNSCKINEEDSNFLAECLLCLEQITKNCASGHEYIDHLSLHVALPLIKKSIEVSLQPIPLEQCCAGCYTPNNLSVDCISLPFTKSVSNVIRNICQKQKSGKTAMLLVKLISELYLAKDVSAVGIKKTESVKDFDPLNPNSSLLQTRTVCFITASLCCFEKSVHVLKAKTFMYELINLTLNSPDQPTYVAAAKGFSGLLNKHPEPCNEIIDKVLNYCTEYSKSSVDDKNVKMNSLTLLIWTTKALVLCNHKRTNEVLHELIKFLGDANVGGVAAAGFDIILRESDEVLNHASHAVIRMMYRQRFFLLVLPSLIAGFNATEPEEAMDDSSAGDSSSASLHQQRRANHLTALSHLLQHLPKQVLLQEFPSLLPMLIHSLRSQESHLLQSVLSTLYFLLQDASELLEGHIDTLLNSFLQLSFFKSNLKVRIKALQCIGASTLLSTISILPHKNRVIKELATALDDRKRDVRAEAAKARSEWYLVGV